jgi:RNA polymerase sigma-70 factor (ECF subfamily)
MCVAGSVRVPFQLHVLDMPTNGVSHVVAFLDDSLSATFRLPGSL